MNFDEWQKWNKALNSLNDVERGNASYIVTEILKYIMQQIKPK